LNDACRKVIEYSSTLAHNFQLGAWRQSEHLKNQHRKLYHIARNLKPLKAGCPTKIAMRQHDIEQAHLDYLKYSLKILRKAETTLSLLKKHQPDALGLQELERFIKHGNHQSDLIYRRVIQHETIPHKEKVFSIFEPHTEWVSKGKAGVPVEFGLRVCVLQDQFGFTLNHRVMEGETDDQVTVPIARVAKERYSALSQVSYDKGFWSKSNLEQLESFLERPVLPKKGRLSEQDKQREHHLAFIRARRQHSAVESDINALEASGLDKCPDKGRDAFKRYVALAVVGSNLKRLGRILLERDRQ